MSGRSIHLIDKEDALLNVADVECEDISEEDRFIILDTIARIPEVDAVPVVRCKDCKYWLPRQMCLAYDTPQNYCEKHMPDDDFYAEIWNSNDFCSRGERKEECQEKNT